MSKRVLLLLVASASIPSVAAAQNAQVDPSIDMQIAQAIAEAKAARVDAARALQRAEESEARLEELRSRLANSSMVPEAAPTAVVQSAGTATTDATARAKKVADAAILKLPDPKNAADGSDKPVRLSLSRLAQDYLGLTTYQDYSATQGAALRFVGSGDDSTAQLGIPFTWRFANLEGERFKEGTATEIAENDKFHASWIRAQPYLTASTSDGIGVIGTAKDDDFTIGTVGVGIDLRWSRSPSRDLTKARNALAQALDEATAFCLKNLKPADPLAKFDSESCRTLIDKQDGGHALYLKGLAPFWGLTEKGADVAPAIYVGFNGWLGRQKEDFYPLSDPAGTGVQTIGALPGDLGKTGQDDRIFNPFFAKIYGGFSLSQIGDVSAERLARLDTGRAWDIGLAGSFGYKSEVAYPKDTEDQSVCYQDVDPSSLTTGFTRCKDINIAVPYTADGFTVAAGLNVTAPRSVFGRPQFSVSAEYFEGTDQWHIKLPFVFAYADDDKLKAGIQLDLRTEGETRFGEVIEDKAVIGIILSHDFDFPFIP